MNKETYLLVTGSHLSYEFGNTVKEINKDKTFNEDIDTLLEQAKKCGVILKKISQNKIIDDEYITNITLQDLLFEITKSFEEITDKKIKLDTSQTVKKIHIK